MIGPYFMYGKILCPFPKVCSRLVSHVFRVSDYKHHPEDVIGGALLGIRYLPLDILILAPSLYCTVYNLTTVHFLSKK